MNIIFTSESTGKASLNVRKILDRFATRIGSDAWEASLTLEGLNTVKALLNRVSSRKSSVACHRITQDGKRVLAWSLGNTRMFNQSGACSTGWTAKPLKREDVNLSYPIRFVTRLVSIVGLLHDIGKANTAFQGVLRASGKLESFRHEAVSAMMLGWLANFENDHDWITAFITASEKGILDDLITSSLKSQVSKHECKSPSNDPVTFAGATATACVSTPVLFGIIWLITSHHRLPGGKSELSMSSANIDHSEHARKDGERIEAVDKIVSDGRPWKNDAWLLRLIEDLKSLLLLVDDPQYEVERNFLFDHLRLFGRPAFQLADHIVSSQSTPDSEMLDCKKKKSKKLDEFAFANTSETNAPEKPLGQRLYRHLLDVSRRASSMVQELLCLRESMPGVDQESMPKLLRKKSSDERFAWQDDAAQAIRSSRSDMSKCGFFGVLIAGTGTGKTIGSLKIAASFKEPLRIIYASPLRSLTLQSGTEFTQLGFGQDDLATIIGDTLIQKIYQSNENYSNKALTDLDNNEFDQESINISGGFSRNDLKDHIRVLQSLDDRGMKMVSTPILAATIDTIMKLADGRRGSYLSHLLRVASSDLIIDEADMFSPNDLIVIGRLMEAAGFWKSRVFLCSATLSPVIAFAFYNAYVSGMNKRNSLEGIETKIMAGWFSDSSKPIVSRIANNDQFQSLHNKFVEEFIPGIVKKRAVADYIRRPKEQKTFDIQSIIKATISLHEKTAVSLPNGRKFSFGCIQVVNVINCQKIAMALCDSVSKTKLSDDVDFRVICLHGRLSLATRTFIDNHLNKMLNRKGPQGDFAPLSNPYVRDFESQSTSKNVMVILVSTMETTGRDHDFDWGIIESKQERDIIQFAGRIRRHRPSLDGDAMRNLIIFSTPISWNGSPFDKNSPLDSKKPPHPFSRFGVADPIGLAKKISLMEKQRIFHTTLYRKVYHFAFGFLPSYPEMLELTYGTKLPFITAERILKDTEMKKGEFTGNEAHTVRACEVARLRNSLFETDSRKDNSESLTDWLADKNKAGRLLNTHQNNYRFRSGVSMEYFWRNHDDKWYIVVIPGKEYDIKSSKEQGKFSEIAFNKTGLLFDINEEVEVLEIQKNTNSFSVKDRVRLSGVSSYDNIKADMSKFTYHCQIGLVVEKNR